MWVAIIKTESKNVTGVIDKINDNKKKGIDRGRDRK